MARYHINAKGEPGVCKAQQACPFGTSEEHYDSAQEARAAYEEARSAVPELHRKSDEGAPVEETKRVGGLLSAAVDSPTDLAVFDPGTQTAFSRPLPRSQPKHAVRSMESLRGRIKTADGAERLELASRLEAQVREVEYLYRNDEAYRAEVDAKHKSLSHYLGKRAQNPPPPLEEPLTPEEEEEAGVPDPAMEDQGAPEEYRGLGIHEVDELIDEEWQEERYAREHQEWLYANRWNF